MLSLKPLFSYANIVSTLALSVALGGVSYAAVTLADGSVTTSKLHDNAVTSPKIRDGQVASADLATSVRSRIDNTYTKAQSDNRFLPRAGAISLTAPLTGWTPAVPASYGVQSYPGFTLLDNLASGGATGVYRLGLTVPSRLQGRFVTLQSVEVCYSAFKEDTLLSRVSLIDATTSGTGSAVVTRPVDDQGDQNDTACRTYAPGTPIRLDQTHTLTLELTAAFSAASQWLVVNRVTANYAT